MDYTFPDMVVTFDGSQSQMCVILMTTDDSIYEFDETVQLQLSSNSMSVSLTPTLATVTITDDDMGMYISSSINEPTELFSNNENSP